MEISESCSKYFTAKITVQKMKFSIKDFSIKCDQIRSFLLICSRLLKNSLMENFIFVCSEWDQIGQVKDKLNVWLRHRLNDIFKTWTIRIVKWSLKFCSVRDWLIVDYVCWFFFIKLKGLLNYGPWLDLEGQFVYA